MGNKIIILTTMLLIFLIGIISAAGINTYYAINLNYDKGELTLLSDEIEQSLDLIDNSFGEYTASVLDYKEDILDIYFFDIPNKVLYDEVDENGTIIGGGETELEEVNFTIYILYYENASEIVIYDKNLTKKLEIEVSMYSKTEKISLDEGKSVKENVTDKGEGDLSKKLEDYWWVLLILLVVLIIIFIISLRKPSKK